MDAEVVCVGLATADTIVSVPRWPPPDGRIAADAIVRAGGGPAATAAVAIARLGHRAAIVGAVGDDGPGAEVRAQLEAEGVDVTHLATTDGPTAESVIVVDRSAGTRSILHRPGAAVAGLPRVVLDPASAVRWVHADHAGAAPSSSVEPARRSLDEGDAVEGLDLVGIGLYAPSATALRARFPGRPLRDGVRAALGAGAVRVVVTLGPDGAVAADGSGAWRVPAASVPVVSTLGAGDVFHGALLASLLDGAALAEAARRANAAAALSCRAVDGRSAIPTAGELDRVLADAPEVVPLVLEPTS